jgi:hypothetical protein
MEKFPHGACKVGEQESLSRGFGFGASRLGTGAGYRGRVQAGALGQGSVDAVWPVQGERQ